MNWEEKNPERFQLGLIFGLMMGTAFVLGAWGIDAYEMWKASAHLPWLRLAFGALLVIPLAGLAGWLVAWIDNALVGLVSWLILGVVAGIWAGHVPYEMVSWAVGRLHPDFLGQPVYPFNESAMTRLWIGAVAAAVLMAIGGALQTMLVDSAQAASFWGRRFFLFLICVPFFGGAGIFNDMIIQRPLRQPLSVVDDLIRFALKTEGQAVDKALARSMHLGAIRSISDLLHQPRSLIMGDYDLETMETGRVLVDFNGEWVRCTVIAGQVSFCQLSSDFYGEAFECLWEGGGQEREGCQVKVGEAAQKWFAGWQSQAGNPWSSPPEMRVRSQYGAVALITVEIGGQVYECRFRDVSRLTLEACSPDPGQAAEGAGLQPARPSSVVEKPALQGVELAQARALLPGAQGDLQNLALLNHYQLSVKLNPDLSFQGQMAVKIRNNESVPLESLYFRLFPNGGASYGNGSLTASEIRVNDQPAATNLSLSNSVLEVKLPQLLDPGDLVQVSLNFRGTVPVDFGGEKTDAYGLYNYTQGVLALSGWYPILAVYDEQGWHLNPASPIGDSVFSDMAFYEVTVATDGDQILAATGVQVGKKREGELTEYRYISGPVRDFFIISSPDFRVKSQVIDGTQVNSYYLPGQEPGGSKGLEVGGRSLQVFNEKFGQYPYVELDIVGAPLRNAGGVEFPGIVLIEASRYDDPDSPLLITTVAHEVAHQWWYNLVGNDVINEPWLDEGLTTFSAGVYFEEAHGAPGYQGVVAYWQGSYERAIQSGKDDQVTRSLTYFEKSSNPGMYGTIVYAKGALFFDQLRKEIGDKAFFAALNDYYQQHKYGIAQASDLLKAFEGASGKQLADFYQEWLYSP